MRATLRRDGNDALLRVSWNHIEHMKLAEGDPVDVQVLPIAAPVDLSSIPKFGSGPRLDAMRTEFYRQLPERWDASNPQV